MSNEVKKVLGILYAELHEIKCLLSNTPVDKAAQYALRNGFMSVINDVVGGDQWVTENDEYNVANILQTYCEDEKKLSELKGYYDIEEKLEEAGITRQKAMTIMKYFYADGSFVEAIEKMDTDFSPIECRQFKLTDFG